MFKEGKNKVEKINLDKNIDDFVLSKEFKKNRNNIADQLKKLSKPVRREAHKKIVDIFNIEHGDNQEEYEKKITASLSELEQVVGNKDFINDINYFLHSRDFLYEQRDEIRRPTEIEAAEDFIDFLKELKAEEDDLQKRLDK